MGGSEDDLVRVSAWVCVLVGGVEEGGGGEWVWVCGCGCVGVCGVWVGMCGWGGGEDEWVRVSVGGG